MGPHAADVDDGAALPAGDHTLDDGLRQEKQCVVELHVRVVGPLVVLEKRFRDEESGRVDEQCRVAVMRGKRASNIGDRSAICQLGGDAPGLTTPARQVVDGVVDTGVRASDDHRAAAVVDDIDRDLSSYAGTAADNHNLLALEMHITLAFLVFRDGSGWTAVLRIDDSPYQGCRGIRA